MVSFLDFFIHLDKHVESFFLNYQTLTYLLICLILFCETGLVFTPFLPGDSLLFAVGATIAKIGILDIKLAIPFMILAVFLGDNTNYFMGKYLGTRLFNTRNALLKKLLKPEYLVKTQNFYNTHGGKTVVLARFIPIIRTFAPFVAGLGAMKYPRYVTYCLTSAIGWVTLLSLLGFFFGKTEIVQKHFELVLISIVFISLLPAVIGVLTTKKETSS